MSKSPPGHLQTTSISDLERAVVEATLQGRGAVAELLADRLRERLAAEGRANVVPLKRST